MIVKKYNKEELQDVCTQQGYMVVPCKDEANALDVKSQLKSQKKCAQAGHIINREGKDIFFVLTRDMVKRSGRPKKEVE